jgi:CO/xanthine dehydrogenase Mo-binding subunit
VYPSIGVTAGSMRGYGTVQSMAYTEMLVGEIAQEIGLDAVGCAGAMCSEQHEEARAPRPRVICASARSGHGCQGCVWTERAKRKADFEAVNPGLRYGMGFGAVQKTSARGRKPRSRSWSPPEGRIKMRHIATEIGTGSTTAQLVAVEPFLGRPADDVDFAVNHWDNLPLHTKDEPYTTPQAKEDELARDPTWTPRLVSPVSASNSAYYFRHATQQAAQLLLKLCLWPAAQSIWSGKEGGGRCCPAPSPKTCWSGASACSLPRAWSR